MKQKKVLSLERKRSRYGLIFLAPWIAGMVLFFLYPIFQSAFFSFSKTRITENGVVTKVVGLSNYNHILNVDPDYTTNFTSALSSFFVTLPFILVVSLILALFLNDKFRGRLFFRSLFFIPVIFASGPVLKMFLGAASGDATEVAVSDAVSFGMIDFTEVLKGIGLPAALEEYLTKALNNLFMMVWQSGIQIILFLAGLQSIPDLLYEVAKVEGATKWEEFWFVTLPMLLRPMLLVIIFTMVETITADTNPVIQQSYNQFNILEYGIGSAMLWFYFVIAGAVVALILLLYSKCFLKRWG